MCTVSFLPKPSDLHQGFILTSNRDEKALRSRAIFPHEIPTSSGTLTFPKDGKAGGTWIAVAETKMICLLNGGFVKHTPEPPYRHSRGKVVVDAFNHTSFQEFRDNYDFSNLEPHTLVMIDFTNSLELVELIWDGSEKSIRTLDASEPHIWSSVTLYDKEMVANRKAWFTDWVGKNKFNIESIRNFHRFGGTGDKQNDLIMKREDSLQTISISTVEHTAKDTVFIYEDLLTEEYQTISI